MCSRKLLPVRPAAKTVRFHRAALLSLSDRNILQMFELSFNHHAILKIIISCAASITQ
jgi:hypothetical protein